MGGSRGGTWMKVRNTFIIFLVSGFWHGANWTFIVWGGLNALYFLPLLLLKRNRTNLGVVAEGRMLPNLRELWQMGITFLLTVFAWVFFRSATIKFAVEYIIKIFSSSTLELPLFPGRSDSLILFLGIAILLFKDWLNRQENITFQKQKIERLFDSDYFYYFCLILVICTFRLDKSEFIYFQF